MALCWGCLVTPAGIPSWANRLQQYPSTSLRNRVQQLRRQLASSCQGTSRLPPLPPLPPASRASLNLTSPPESRSVMLQGQNVRQVAASIMTFVVNVNRLANATMNRIDVSRRLRRAILLNDLLLVKRIVRNNPRWLRNPDFEDKSNTSLHLAAQCGYMAIAEFLIEQGHEDDMVSRNNDWETPLMLAAMAGKEEVGVMLAKRFPECIPWQTKCGLDAVRLPALPTLSSLSSSSFCSHPHDSSCSSAAPGQEEPST